jgi:ELWxxDGT repeat protein
MLSLCALLVAQVILTPRANAAPGGLNASFGMNGEVLIDLGSPSDFATGVVVQLDGRIVAAGTSTAFGSDDAGITPGSLDPGRRSCKLECPSGRCLGIGHTLFFSANDGVHGNELWRSDGTRAGTVMVKDIRPGSRGSSPGAVLDVKGTLFFGADDGTHGFELWRSDGTEVGTVMVKDIWPGSGTSSPINITDVGGTLFFGAADGTHGFELWRSDGTRGGTTMVKDIWPGSGTSSPSNITDVGGTLFFGAADGTHGFELWRSDGTRGGTTMVKDIWPGPHSSQDTMLEPFLLINVVGTLFIVADDGTHGFELWRSDGTRGGTVMVKDIWPGPHGSQGGPGSGLLSHVGATLFFRADDGAHGFELWKTDGTEVGTVMVKDIRPGPDSSIPESLLDVEGTLFFGAADGTHGFELWKSDGTEAGTVMVRDTWPGPHSSEPQSLTDVGGTLFFVAEDGIQFSFGSTIHGYELWRSDGTDAETVIVKDIRPGSESSLLQSLTDVGGTLFFGAADGTHGFELWKSDGTAPGTTLVKDINPGSMSSNPSGLGRGSLPADLRPHCPDATRT